MQPRTAQHGAAGRVTAVTGRAVLSSPGGPGHQPHSDCCSVYHQETTHSPLNRIRSGYRNKLMDKEH